MASNSDKTVDGCRLRTHVQINKALTQTEKLLLVFSSS